MSPVKHRRSDQRGDALLRILGMAGQLLGRAEQSTPEARKGRALARGVDGERACRAIIAVPMNALRYASEAGCVPRRFDSPWSKGPCNPPPDNPERHAVVTHVFDSSVTYVSGPDIKEGVAGESCQPF